MAVQAPTPEHAGLVRLAGGVIVAVIAALYLNALFFRIDEISRELPDISPVGAALIFLLFVYGAYMLASGDVEIWNSANGTDGRASTSKFQFFLWTIVVVFGYVAVVAALLQDDADAGLPDVPRNLLLALGISVATGLSAKAATVNAVDSGKEVKTSARNQLAGPLFRTDGGQPDLAKIQLLAFTFIAVAVFLFGVFDALAHIDAGNKPAITSLPDIDPMLMLLMGIGSVGYVGGKVIVANAPFVTSRTPGTLDIAATGTERKVTLTGTNFGPSATAGYVMLGGTQMPDPPDTWTDTQVVFSLPASRPDGTAWAAGDVTVQVAAHGGVSNELKLSLTSGSS